MVCHMLFSLWGKKENKITLELPSATLFGGESKWKIQWRI